MSTKSATALTGVMSAGITLAIGAAIIGTIKLIDYVSKAYERQVEKLKEVSDAYKQITSDLETAEEKLVDIGKQIDEINNKDTLTLTDQADLERLQQENKELENQIALLKMQAEAKGVEQNKEAVKTAEKFSKDYLEMTPGTDGVVYDSTYDILLNTYNSLIARQDELNEKKKNGIILTENETKELAELPANITSQLGKLADVAQKAKDIAVEITNTDEESTKWKNTLSDIVNFVTTLGKTPTEIKLGKLDDLLNSKEFSDVAKKLKELGESGELTPEIVAGYTSFNKALADIELTADEVANSLNKVSESTSEIETEDLTALANVLKETSDKASLFSTAQKEMSADGTLTNATLQKLIESTEDYMRFITISGDKILFNAEAYQIYTNELAKSEVQLRKNEIAEKQKIITSTKATIAAKEASMAQLEASASSMTSNIYGAKTALLEQIAAYKKEIEVLKGDVSGHEERIEVLNTETDIINASTVSLDKNKTALEELRKASSSLESEASTLSSAFKEQKENGDLSLKTVLSLIEAGYAAALSIDTETGAVRLNADAYMTLANAKIEEQLASIAIKRNEIITQLKNERKEVNDLADSYRTVGERKIALRQEAIWEKKLDGNVDLQALALEEAALLEFQKGLGKVVTGDYSGSGSSSSSKDAYKEAAEKAIKEIQYLRDKNEISEEEYLNRLRSLNEKYFKDKAKYLDDYRKYEIEVLKGLAKIEESRLDTQLTFAKEDKDYNKQIEIYKQMQDMYHEQANKLRGAGLEDTDLEVQEWKQKWITANNNILDAMKARVTSENDIISHRLFLNEKNQGNPQERINDYRQMQDNIHNLANEYRAMGLVEESEYIQDLQKLWWQLQDNIIQSQEKIYTDWLSGRNLNASLFVSESKDNREIIDYYRETMSGIEAEISKFSDKTDDYSKERLATLYKDLDDTKYAIANTLDNIVKEATSALDQINSFYNATLDAARELEESGFITVEQYKSIIAHGVEYLSFLEDENGQLVISKENIEKVIAARTEQLTLETALNYVHNIRDALISGETEKLNQLIYSKSIEASTTWELVYAYANLNQVLGLSNEQYDQMMANLNNLRSLNDKVTAGIGQQTGALKAQQQETLKTQEKALNDLLKYVMELIRWEAKYQIEGINEQIKGFETLIKQRKEELRLAQQKLAFEKEVANKVKSIAKLQEELAKLERDTSGDPAIKARKQQLAEQIAEMQGKIDEDINKKYVDEMEQAYDEELAKFKELKEEEIKVIEKTVSSEEKVYQLAIQRINSQWNSLYNDLIRWNTEYGSVVNSDIQNAWSNASFAVQQYGSYLEAVMQTQQQLNALSQQSYSNPSYSLGSSGNYDTNSSASAGQQAKDANAKYIVSQMKLISAQWKPDISQNVYDELNRQQQDLANQLRAIGINVERRPDGVWYLNDGRKLYDVYSYHTGTWNAGKDSNLNDNEVLTVLEKDEAVLTKEHKKAVYQLIDMGTFMADKLGPNADKISSMLSKFSSTNLLPEITSTISKLDIPYDIVSKNNNDINIKGGDIIIHGNPDGITISKIKSMQREWTDDIFNKLNNVYRGRGHVSRDSAIQRI